MALFRSEVVGALTRQEMDHGRLKAELRALSGQRFRPPGANSTRTFSVPTLERWYYAYKHSGLKGLLPRPRTDKGRAQTLPQPLRHLLLDIRREHPSASVPLIIRTLEADGRLEPGTLSESTLRRLFAEYGLPTVHVYASDSATSRAHGDVAELHVPSRPDR